MNASNSNLTRRANQGHSCTIPQSCKRPSPRNNGRVGCDFGSNPQPTIEIAPLDDANACAWPNGALVARLPGKLDMNPAPDSTMTTAIAATGQTKTDAGPRIKLQPHGFSIDHPDPELGEQLMANALGATDRDAMDGILRQLVRASVSGGCPDKGNSSFMISMVKSTRPSGFVKTMMVAQIGLAAS